MQAAAVAEILVRGLVYGAIYATAAMGLALVFGVLRIVHMAYADLMVLSGLIFFALVSGVGTHPALALTIALVCTALLSIVMDLVGIRRIKGTSAWGTLLLLFGISLALQDAMRTGFGNTIRTVSYLTQPISILGSSYGLINLVTIGCGAASGLTLLMLLNSTNLGRAIRATAESPELAEAHGVDTAFIRTVAISLSGILAAGGGVLWLMNYYVFPGLSQALIMTLFSIVILGGLGSIPGAFAAGIILGISQSLTARFISSEFALAVSYIIILLTLYFRPQGLLGWQARR